MNETNTQVGGHKTGKYIVVVLLILAMTAIAVISILRDRIVNQQLWTINVSGQGKVSYQPDVAKVILGVKVDKATTADKALKELNTKIDKIYQALLKEGVIEDNIQTQNYNLYPQYDYIENQSILSGYNANQTIVVKVENIEQEKNKVADIVSVATESGVNQIDGISFEYSNLEDIKQQARLSAITDAKSKAGAMALALGVELDEVVGWWENYTSPMYQDSYYKGDMAGYGGGGVGSPTIPSSSQEMVIEVNLNYRIK